MRAILLAAGLGTRLRPLTNSIPKCLVPIKGKPLLEIWLDRLAQADISPFLINTHYLSDQVEQYINGCAYREQVRLVHEPELLGTAGTLISNMAFFQSGDGLLIHADNYCLADLGEFVQAHRQRPPHCVMTMMTFRTDDPGSCGIVELDPLRVMTKLHEKVANPPGNLANGAVYILSANAMKEIESKIADARDFSVEILPRFEGRIFTYETQEIFRDIGTVKNYEMANKMS